MSDLEDRLPELLDDAVTGEPSRRPDFASRAERAFEERRARLRRGAGVVVGIAVVAGVVVGVAHLPKQGHYSSATTAGPAMSGPAAASAVSSPGTGATGGAAAGGQNMPAPTAVGPVPDGTPGPGYRAWSTDGGPAVIVGDIVSIPVESGSADGTPALVESETATTVAIGVRQYGGGRSSPGGAPVRRRLTATISGGLGGRRLVDLAGPASPVSVVGLTATTSTPAGTLVGLLPGATDPDDLVATAVGSSLQLRWTSGVCENDQVVVQQTSTTIRYGVVVYSTVPPDSPCVASARLHDVTVPLSAPAGSRSLVDVDHAGADVAVQILPSGGARPSVDGSPAG